MGRESDNMEPKVTAISPQKTEKTVQKREMKTKPFTGPTLEEALRNAREALGSDLLHTDIVRDVHEATATAQARAAADALKDVEQRFPKESFDRHTPTIVQEAQSGTTEVEEFEERDARKVWRKGGLRGAQIEAIECTVPAKNGLMGMGRKPGKWTVQWSAPFIAEASYKMPAVVTAMFWE